MADTPEHSVSVAGVVVDSRDRVLVIQRRDNDHWELPGGVLELAEAPEEGLRREVLEETGVLANVVRLSGVYKNMRRGVVALVFRCVPVDGEVATSDESRTVRWMTVEEACASMDAAYAIRVRDGFADDVQVRTQDGVSLTEESAPSAWTRVAHT